MRKQYRKVRFLRINTITLGSVLVLILVGSIVRVLGAGMGCPDWPKCFGSYIPPTSSEALPSNYQDVFREKRLIKNERLAGIFLWFGDEELAQKITNDPAVLVEQEFDATKAWVEYINRLIGVIIGLLIILNMLWAFSIRKLHPVVPWIGVVVFVLTVFQGWVGSIVVSTNLLHGFITFHMLLAIAIVALLIYMNVTVRDESHYYHSRLFWITFATLLLFIPQIIFGTEVRGTVDDLLVSTTSRANWINYLPQKFYIHRSYSWLLIVGIIAIWYMSRATREGWLIRSSVSLLILASLAMIAGVGMANFEFPVYLQPLHLLLAVAMFSVLFYLTLRIRISR